MRVVLQRCDRAELLIDGKYTWVTMGRGLIAYVTFAGEAHQGQMENAARTILQLPLVCESGPWGII